MAWLGKVSLGGFPDLAGAVTKFSESVKNIEKNFDSALGLEEKPESSNEASGLWRSASDTKGLFDPVMSFMGQKGGDASSSELPEKVISPQHPAAAERDNSSAEAPAMTLTDLIVDSSASEDKATDKKEEFDSQVPDGTADLHAGFHDDKDEYRLQAENASATGENVEDKDSECLLQHSKEANLKHDGESHLEESTATTNDTDTVEQLERAVIPVPDESPVKNEEQVNQEKEEADVKQFVEKSFPGYENAQDDNGKLGPEISIPNLTSSSHLDEQIPDGSSDDHVSNSLTTTKIPDVPSESLNNDTNSSVQSEIFDGETRHLESSSKDQLKNSGMHAADFLDPATKLDKMDKEMRMMEAALQGAARQAQAKADEISKLMNENEQLKSKIESLEKKSVEAEVDALREEYHQRVSSLERKVYALTRERDTLRREQNKRSDVAALLKEKDEIISQVMAEGENLSKKQAVQESTIRKLRAQIRELEEEKQLLNSKLQVEETKVESIKKDKATTEKLLQETIEKNQAELTAQKDFYTSALNAAKEAEALAETRVNNEAKVELESRLREAAEREAMLVQTLEELRQTLSRTERQAVFREDMLQRDIDDLQKRYQASELRYNELITQVPESTRPLLRQIEAMQEAATRKAEAWAGVEQSLNSRLEAAEAKAATSEEKERIMNDRLSQTLSRMTVLETQIACLRTEQTQLSRTLEKERQRASESRQEYLAALEEVATQEGRVKQLEDDLRELRAKHKQEMQEVLVHRELLEKELEREKAARLELERNSHHEASVDERLTANRNRPFAENGNLSMRKLSSAGSISSTEESFYLQASLDSTDSVFSDRRTGEAVSPYFLKSMTPSAFEAALRQKDGELASYVSRLASLESIRDSLAEELVKMTAHCEKLRAEAALLPGIRAELEALRRRHSSALELMGERDEELEELRADIIDLKEMYREQIDLLVNTIQTMGPSAVAV